MGTFQLAGSGMTRYLVELKPERIEDIMAMIALYRPGPMANIPEYIARKKGLKKVTYYHPGMKKFLEKSFGILVFQDDLLFTAIELAGYDWKWVDKLRKAVGKKIPSEMAKQHEFFVKGCMKHSKMTEKEAEGLWKLFEPFQGYGFNKAHAASYAMVAYKTSYMKANYPVEFMTALLTAESNNIEKVSAGVQEAKRMGIEVYPPDINESSVGFAILKDKKSLEGKAIRFGLSAIKNVGTAAIEAILDAREEANFNSFADFLVKVDNRRVNKKVVESLIKVGALSKFGKRAALLGSLDEVRSKVIRPNKNKGQQDLFGKEEVEKSSFSPTQFASELPEFSDEELQTLERQLLGFSLSDKPLSELLEALEVRATHKIQELSSEHLGDSLIRVAGVVKDIRVVLTRKSGQEMAFVKVEDETGVINLVIFPRTFSEVRGLLVDGKPILAIGRVDFREDEPSLLVNSIETEEALQKSTDNNVYLKVPKLTTIDRLKALKDLLTTNPGDQPVTLVFEGKSKKRVKLPFRISWSERLARMITEVLETSNMS